MRKTALLLAAAMVLAAPSMALAAKKKGKKAKAKPAAAQSSKAVDNSKFFRDGFDQIFVPFRAVTGSNVGVEGAKKYEAKAVTPKKAKKAKKGKKAKAKAKKKA